MTQSVALQNGSIGSQVAHIADHLKKRPIAIIFEKSEEKSNLTALRFMCILDYRLDENKFYSQINQSSCPHLLSQLLQFCQFEKFKYFDYHVHRKIRKNLLKCLDCDFIGPHAYTLTHMAISHNVIIRSEMCVYCNKEDFKSHIRDDSLKKCYRNYIKSNRIDVDKNVRDIVVDFYEMLKGISEKLEIDCVENEYIVKDPKVFIRKSIRDPSWDKSIESVVLNNEFNLVISHLFGGNNASRLLRKPSTAEGCNVIAIRSEDDDDDSNGVDCKPIIADHSVQPTQSGQLNFIEEIETEFLVSQLKKSVI